MTKRTGFGSYQHAPGLTNIEKVAFVLNRIRYAMDRRLVYIDAMVSAGLGYRQATALVNWAMIEADRARDVA